ncbi:hypothetical protein AB0F91_34600 [Amycolatopsis sp. NPDC023774]
MAEVAGDLADGDAVGFGGDGVEVPGRVRVDGVGDRAHGGGVRADRA